MPYGSLAAKNAAERYFESKNTYIIDAHSHFGIDNFWPNVGDLDNYIKYAEELNIKEVNAMPVACPTINKDGKRICLLVHGDYNENMSHYKIINDNESTQNIPITGNDNPYKEANDMLFQICKETNTIKMNYVPLIHPYYFNVDDILENVSRGAKMFKLHGISMGVIPEKITDEFFELIEATKIPLIIHTDYSNEDNLLSRNSAINWYEVLKKYDIKVYFAHAARLDHNIIERINTDDRYILGIGPDKYLSCPNQNIITPSDYLKYCFEQIDINKIVFDIDYPWNINGFNDLSLDWDSESRINSLLNKEEQSKVYSRNIRKFLK